MKKKILIFVSVAVISAASGWNFSQNRNEVALSDMALENIEALADETIGGGSFCYCVMHIPCFSSNGSQSGSNSSSSYTGPNCNKSFHSHNCSSCRIHTTNC
ncbi:MAG: NVEALA domain-containing protein [Prevotellaceae bacterium]|jgi:hypothetical protein|nr:NVEALA domain-containing protein [Prevotellaceae bacterium]